MATERTGPTPDANPADHDERVARAWEMARDVRFCMFGNWDGSRQQLRPLSSMPDREAGVIRFLVSARTSAGWPLVQYPTVSLSYADPGAGNYLAMVGTARLDNDRARIAELWSPFAKAWWDSPEDPDIRLLTVHPERAEIWDGPSVLVSAAIMLGASLTGGRPDLGEHESARLANG